MVVLGTMMTRFLPFLLFSGGRKTPDSIRYLGRVLPAAVFAMLVVYSLKDTTILSGSHGLPELLASLLVIGLHLWKRNMMLSIAGGTVCYILNFPSCTTQFPPCLPPHNRSLYNIL